MSDALSTTFKARSQRWPLARGGVVGLLCALLPFVWVVEVSSCGNPPYKTVPLTGASLVSKPEEALVLLGSGWLPMALVPVVAWWVDRAGLRLWVHVVGLLTTGWGVYLTTFFITFTLFAERKLRPAGYLVMLALLLALVEAVLRVWWGTREWLATRRPLRSAPP